MTGFHNWIHVMECHIHNFLNSEFQKSLSMPLSKVNKRSL